MVLFILFILCIFFFIFIYVQFHDLSHSVLLHEFSFLFWFSPFFSAVKHTCGKEAAHFTRNILDRISFSLMRVSKVQFVVQFCSIFLAILIARFSGFFVWKSSIFNETSAFTYIKNELPKTNLLKWNFIYGFKPIRFYLFISHRFTQNIETRYVHIFFQLKPLKKLSI